jgi:hypothetical protein
MTQIHALMDVGASANEVAAVRAVLHEEGFDVHVEAIVPPQGEGAYWLVLIAIPPAAFLQAFFSEAGKDAWKRLKRLLEDLKVARGGGAAGSGQIILRRHRPIPDDIEPDQRVAVLMGWIGPRDTETELILSPDMPDEALRTLFELELNKHRGGYIFWDDARREWRSGHQ